MERVGQLVDVRRHVERRDQEGKPSHNNRWDLRDDQWSLLLVRNNSAKATLDSKKTFILQILFLCPWGLLSSHGTRLNSQNYFFFISTHTLYIRLSFLELNWTNSALLNWEAKWNIYTRYYVELGGEKKKLIRGDDGESEFKVHTKYGIVYWVIFFDSPTVEWRTKGLTSI